ncbi:MAG: 23S rRNA (cytosine1962-C5)-methyltransferase [Motiliproteus sp.]|jgi:23S rRNA (cytosine1962-C5)-methyltransferase
MMSNTDSPQRLATLLQQAFDRRQPLLEQLARESTDCYRLFHGTSEGEPGLTVDRYGPQLIIQSFHRPLDAAELEAIVAKVNSLLGVELQPFYHARQTSQTSSESKQVLVGADAASAAICSELGVSYRTRGVHRGIDPLLFLDLRAARRWVQSNCAGLSVLNLFAYTCGLGVCAAKAGASHVVNIDFAKSALAVGRENAELNELAGDKIQFIHSDFFPAIQQLGGQVVRFRRGRDAPPPKHYQRFEAQQFDLVFLDPPRLAKSPFGTVDLVRDYPSVFKPSLLATKPGGRLICTNNVAQVDRDAWLDQLKRSATKAGRPIKGMELIEPEADFPSFDGKPPLKMVVLEV